MDWFLYDNGLRHKRVNCQIGLLEQANLTVRLALLEQTNVNVYCLNSSRYLIKLLKSCRIQ